MKYRILIDGERCYPQKKGLLFWNFFPGHPYYPKRYTFDLNSALEIIEEEGVNIHNRPIQIKRGDSYEYWDVHLPIAAAILIGTIIFFILLFLKKAGMI